MKHKILLQNLRSGQNILKRKNVDSFWPGLRHFAQDKSDIEYQKKDLSKWHRYLAKGQLQNIFLFKIYN